MRMDDSYVRINYVRYADDFVISIEGSHKLAEIILNKVETFVNKELKLRFNPEKTSILKFIEQPFRFLGFVIKPSLSKRGIKPSENITVKDKVIQRRKRTRLRILMDTQKVLKKLAANGFIRKRISHLKHGEHEYRGTFKGNLINLDHPDILRYYNSVLRGVLNYYNFSRNRVEIARIG